MGFLDLFKRPDINREVGECGSVPGAVLVDVRSRQEYLEGHNNLFALHSQSS